MDCITGFFPGEPLSHHQSHANEVWTVSPHGTKMDRPLYSQGFVGKRWYFPFTDIFPER